MKRYIYTVLLLTNLLVAVTGFATDLQTQKPPINGFVGDVNVLVRKHTIKGYKLDEDITGINIGAALNLGYHFNVAGPLYVEPIITFNIETSTPVTAEKTTTYMFGSSYSEKIALLTVRSPISGLVRIGALTFNRVVMEAIIGIAPTLYSVSDDFKNYSKGTKIDDFISIDPVLGFRLRPVQANNSRYGLEVTYVNATFSPIKFVEETWSVRTLLINAFYDFSL